MDIILASASPRRREIMERAGFEFRVMPAQGDEEPGSRGPEDAAAYLAEQKAREVACSVRESIETETLVIGADTVVSCEGEIFGKPLDRDDAARMLRRLSGRSHRVFTGVFLITVPGRNSTAGYQVFEKGFVTGTEVLFSELSEEEIAAYLATGEADDKAGAYAIQGRFAKYVTGINGDYSNVVGLPISMLYRTLKDEGLI